MNQDAFRSLLGSKPGPSGSAGSSAPRSSGVLGGTAPKRSYGATKALDLKDLAAPKQDLPAVKAAAELTPAFVPRKTAKKNGKYVDRAEMRRLGLENEYQPVEKLLEDFEARAKENGEDQATIDQQTREYLGGDAQHSILVKGLDFNLLATRKAELAAQAADAYDDDLEAALGEPSGSGSGTAPLSSAPIQAPPPRKTRDEIVAELKRKRAGGGAADDDEDDIMGVKKSRPGATAGAVEEAKAPALPSKFKSIVKRADPEPETRKKKKKKKIAAASEDTEHKRTGGSAPTGSSSTQAPETGPGSELPPTPGGDPALKVSVPVAAVAAQVPDEDDEDLDVDIFAGVGEYKLQIDSDESEHDETEYTKPREPAAPMLAEAAPDRPRRNWFGDVVAEPSPEEPRPAVPPPRDSSRSPSPDPSTLTRLQPLSSHGPSARELLAAADEADRLAKRRANKAKWRAKQGLPAQGGQEDDGDEDERLSRGVDEKETKKKLHKDTQRLSVYMANKKKKEGG